MTSTRKILMITSALIVACTSSAAQAVTTKNNLHTRPVAAIAGELGVQPADFVACFYNVNPAAPGTSPTKNLERANKAILLPCLQAVNGSITNDLLDRVMDKYRGRHVRPTNS